MGPAHLLIFRFSALGDVAMTVPVVRALRQQHPEIQITVVSRPFFKPLFDTIPHVNFYPAELSGRHQGMRGLLRLFAELRPLQPTAIADLHQVLRTRVLSGLFRSLGVRTATLHKGRAEKKALTALKNKTLQPLKPMVQRHADVLAQLGFLVDLTAIDVPEPQPLSQSILSITGLKGNDRWVAIAPLAQYDTKVYPADLMQEVIAQLSAQPHLKVFVLGGKNEIPALQARCGNAPNTHILAGQLHFAQELELFPHFDAVLSMDSGNAHIAALFGLPVITLWGHTHPAAGFVPFGQPEHHCLCADRALYPWLPTSVYGNKTVAGYEDVMRSIAPQTVVKAVLAALPTP